MKSSSCMLFLGWWLARQWRLSGGQPYPKLYISVFPYPEVIQGKTVHISCGNAPYSGAKFYLLKQGTSQAWQAEQPLQVPSQSVSFYIFNVQQSDGGNYMCAYCLGEGPNPPCSSFSDVVSIVITAEVYPKPSIWVSPGELVTLGENVSIHCKSEHHSKAEFTLHKAVFLDSYDTKKTESDEVVFPIERAEVSHGGTYQCRYCFRSAFYKHCSNYSDKVYINITDPSFSRPSIKIRPKPQISLGLNATIECQVPEKYYSLTFFLLKSGNLIASQREEPRNNTTQFLLSRVRPEDAGSYSCQYHRVNPFVRSEPSDPVELTVTDKSSLITWTSIGAGLLVLVLFLLLLAFILYRKRRKGPTGSEQSEPVNGARNSSSLKPDTEEDPNRICYAVLNHHSMKPKQAVVTVRVPESCTYAPVAQGRTMKSL